MAHRWVWLLNDSDMSKAAAYTKPAVKGVQDFANKAAMQAQFAMLSHREKGFMHIETIHRPRTFLDSYIVLRDPDPDKGAMKNASKNGSAISFELGYRHHKSGEWVEGAGVLSDAVGGL